MPKKFFTFSQLLLLILLVVEQSRFGFGEDSDDLEGDGIENGGDQNPSNNNNNNREPEPESDDDSNSSHGNKQLFTAVSSLFFRPGTDYTVFISANPHPKNESLLLKCVLMANSHNTTTIQSGNLTLYPGESGHISIPLPREMPRRETVWRLFVWSMTNESLPHAYKYEAPHTLINSSLASAERQSLKKAGLQSVFIQTDKPAYKPEDLVRIRVITMGSNDLPHLTSGVNITIIDSKGTVMKKWKQPLELPPSASLPSNVSSNGSVALFGEFQKKKNGLSSYEYQLSSEPILGNWTIQVEAGNIKEKMYFDVKKYILPKFQVKIETPSVLYGTGNISTTAIVKASYTYGKDLHGTGTVTATSSYDGRTKIQQIVVKDGEVKVPLAFTSPRTHSTIHTITANVTEKNTGRWQIGTKKVRIYPQEKYTIKWINKPASYKPGLPLTVQLKITAQDGFPVKDVSTNSLRVTFSPSLNLPEKKTSIALSGLANFTFPTPLQRLPANSKLQVMYKKSTFDFTLPPAENATSSGVLIEITSPSDSTTFIQGHSYNFTIRSNKPIQPELFQYLLWDEAAMDVYGAQTIINTQREPATEFPFSLRIPKGDFIDLKVFVYFETEYRGTTQIISTFKAINTHNYLKIRVSRPIPKRAPIPAPVPVAEGNNSSVIDIGLAGVNSTVEPTADAPVETTSAPSTTTTTTPTPEYDDYIFPVETTSAPPTTKTKTRTRTRTTTTTPAPEYEYEDLARDDPAAGETEEPQAQSQAQISDKLQVEPGDAVEIHFETYPDSTIAIRGIDQSLLLLTEQDNDLNQEAVESKRALSQPRKSQLDNIPTDNSSFLTTFRRLGIAVLSNENFDMFDRLGTTAFKNGLEEVEMAPSENELLDGSTIPQFDSRLRTKFPETWLWEEFESSSNSSTTTLSKILPDTLTSWIISGFSLNPQTGLGVASPATITGFMPFFVTLNLPYSVVKYEAFDLQVIVHNHLEGEVKVFVTLFNRHGHFDFDFEDSRNNPQNAGNRTRSIKVQKNHAALAHFVITPLVFGDIPIEVKIVTDNGTAGDSILRHLKVTPDGVRETESPLLLFDPEIADKNLSRTQSLDVEFPRGMVKGASSLQLTVVGDPMGTMLSNLGTSSSSSANVGHLISLPGGCGSQNMYPFVSNVLALVILSETNSQAPNGYNFMQQARTHLQNGYQHQLQYRKSDGAFGTWAHTEGSPSLTSLVFRWFVVAQRFITIDNYVITSAANYVRRTQNSDGSFSSDVVTTAKTILDFIKVNERSNSDLDLRVAIQNGMNFISRKAVYDLDDNYIFNLVTATLMAGNHPEKTRFFEKMEKAANTTVNPQGVKVKYWDMRTKTRRASDPEAIEMTSYALLAHLWRKSTLDVSTIRINNWLLSRRNARGGFISTRDSVVGSIALAEFALRPKAKFGDEVQMNIRASSSSSSSSSRANNNPNDVELAVSVDPKNQMVLQEFSLPNTTRKLTVQARGSGPALVQLTKTWYMPIRDRATRSPRDHFNVTVKMTIPDPEEPTETELRFCVNSYHTSGAEDSIASVQLPTGYIFSPMDYEEGSNLMAGRPGNVQRFDLSDGNTKMDVYYSEIKGHPPTCLSLPASQHIEVTNATNPPIHVYEYANPARKARIVYEPAHNITLCQLCRHTRACGGEVCDFQMSF